MSLCSLSERNETIQDYALNCSRFMRNRFTDDEIFDNIFRAEGGHPDVMLRRLLEPCNPGKDLLKTIELREYFSVSTVFEILKSELEDRGALIIERFLVFPEFCDSTAIQFDGDFKSKAKYAPEKNVCRALLVVGVALTPSENEMGGLALLVQNTWEKKPFVVIGLDLLRSMNINQLLGINPGLSFEPSPHVLPEGTHVTQSGAPPQNASLILASRILDFDYLAYEDEDSSAESPFGWSPFPKKKLLQNWPTASEISGYWMQVDPNFGGRV